MTHQLSTAASGAGELYATSTGSGEHRQVVVVSTSGGSFPVALSSGTVTLSSKPSLGPSTDSIGALSSGAAFIGSVAISSAVNLDVSLLTSPLSVQQNGGTPWNFAFSSSGLDLITTATTGNKFLPVRLTDGSTFASSGNVIGSVALSSAVTLAQSTTTVVGIVGLSSAVTLSSGSLTLGTLTTGTVVGLTTTSVVGLTTTSQVALTSGTLTLGTLTTGTVVGLTTTSNVGLTTVAANIVSLSTTVLPVLAYSSGGATPAGQVSMLGGVVGSTGIQAAQTSGTAQNLLVDQVGRMITMLYQSPRAFATANLVTAAVSSGQTVIAAQGANTVAHITALQCFSSAGTTALGGTIVSVFSSCGMTSPRWIFPVDFVRPSPLVFLDFDPPLMQQTANNAWQVTCSSSGVVLNVTAQYFITST